MTKSQNKKQPYDKKPDSKIARYQYRHMTKSQNLKQPSD